MLSILIPTYNYNVYPLAKKLHQQAIAESIAFEIIVIDDASPDIVARQHNEKINALSNSSYKVLPANIGRSAIRNLLAQKAAYNWMLFLDADTMPVYETFIKKYIDIIDEPGVIYGGIKYQENRPEQNEVLRWIYGNGREVVAAEERKKNPYLSFLTLNFCIHKNVFLQVCFNEEIPNLRCEDTLFSFDLKKNNIPVYHIDNVVYHLGLESSSIFLNKSEESLLVIKYITDNMLLDTSYTKMTKWYYFMKRKKLLPLMRFWHRITGPALRKSILGAKPNLFIFDLYRLGYLCSLK